MIEFLEKFNNLPVEVKQKISSGAVMTALEELEGKYGVDLAAFVIRVVIGELYYKNLTANLIIEFSLAPEAAEGLAKELEGRVFAVVMDYLGRTGSARVLAPAVRRAPIGTNVGTQNLAFPRNENQIVGTQNLAFPPSANYLEEDKKDIAAMGKTASSLKDLPPEKTDLMLAETIKEANIGFASENLANRFKDILRTYLRGVRAKIDVRQILLKDIASGGVKMLEADADRVLSIAQKKIAAEESKLTSGPSKISAKSTASGTSFIFNEEEIKQVLAQRAAKTKTVIDRDAPYDLTMLNNYSSERTGGKPESKSDIGSVSMTGEPLPGVPLKKVSSELEKNETLNPVSPQNDDAKRTAAVVGNKKRMEDIKPAPLTMSPIDELAYLDLVNFRRLDPSPAKRIAKIEEKIALLEKEGIDKKIEGISAWRQNPVSKTYLAMGQESIDSGKTVEEIIKERKDQGLNYLAQEEFEAVMDLNNNLRF